MPRSNKSEFNGTKPARRTPSRRRLAAIALSVALLLMPLLALKLYIWKYPMRWSNSPEWIWTKDFVRKGHSEYYKTIIIGDSTTNASFIPEIIGEDVLDLARGSNCPSNMYYVLKQYLSHNKAPEKIYLAFYSWHFYHIGGFTTGVMTGYFTPEDEAEYLRNIMRFNDTPEYAPDAKSEYQGYRNYLRYRLVNFTTYWPYLKNSGFSNRLDKNKETFDTVTSHRGTHTTRVVTHWEPSAKTVSDAVFGQTENHSGNHNWRHFTVSPLQDFYYRKILDLCKERGIFIRIQVLPIPLENYGPGYWDEFRAYHEEALAGYDSWTLDTSPELASATTGGYPIGDFADDHHFNNHGSLKFSRMIRERYPEDFAEGAVMPVSDNTLAGLEEYLCMENMADMILQWLLGTGRSEGGVPLSALFITRNGHKLEEDRQLAAVLGAEYPGYEESLVGLGGDGSACYFTGDGHTASLSSSGGSSLTLADGDVSLSAFDDGRKICARLQTVENGQPRSEEIASPEDGADLFVLVFNNRTGSLVTSKSFRFTGWSYVLLAQDE
ncbi:MAG: hypothetical protein IJR93_01410 [Treponema sp.]|nr:hypothetical protein [Treponema sp.]